MVKVGLSYPHSDCILKKIYCKSESLKEEYLNKETDKEKISEFFVGKYFKKFERWTGEEEEPLWTKEGFRTDNLLIKGDNLFILNELLKTHRGKVDLIYIDPPYNAGNRDFCYQDNFKLESWLVFFKNRIELMRELLSERGSIYVHLDYHAGHYAKIIMDEVFGAKNFVNEIIWYRTDPGGCAQKKGYSRGHSNIFFYARNYKKMQFNLDAVRTPYSESMLKKEKNGTRTFGRIPNLHKLGKKRMDVWQINILNSQARERKENGYPGQKPEKLIEIIIKASSNPGDLVLDCFAGAGTTAAVAEKLGRRWITCDVGNEAIEMTKRRLLRELKGNNKFTYCELEDVNSRG